MLKPLLLIAALTVTAQSFASQVVTRIIDTHAGHASVTKFADGSVMVFDAGRYSYAEHIVEQIKAFADDGVIELLILSHTDGDHVGAVPEIFEAFTVHKVLRLGYVRCDEKPRQRNYCPWYFANEAVEKHEASEETIDLNLAEMEESIIGEEYVFGDATLSVVSGFSTPPEDWNLTDGGSDWLNAGSIVVRLEYEINPFFSRVMLGVEMTRALMPGQRNSWWTTQMIEK